MIVSRLARRALVAWAANCLGLLAATGLLPHFGYSSDAGTLLLSGAILALVNLAVRPFVVVMVLPALLLTLGLAVLLVNALMLALTSDIVSGLATGGFFSTVAAAVVIAVVNLLVRRWTGTTRRGRLHALGFAWRRAH